MLNSLNAFETHAFLDAEPYFSETLHEFHEVFIDDFILLGVAQEETPLDEVPFIKSPHYPQKFFERVVGGLMASNKSLFNALHFMDGDLKAFCALLYLNNEQEIDDFFWFQKVFDWERQNTSSFQVWSLKNSVSLNDMNDHWLYYEA